MTERKVSGYLSKSLFIRGHQCHKSLWLHKYQPELKEEADEALKARFRSGHEVGALAQRLFPGGVEVPYDGLTHHEQLAMTQKLLDEGKETIYEATFEHDGVFVKAMASWLSPKYLRTQVSRSPGVHTGSKGQYPRNSMIFGQ